MNSSTTNPNRPKLLNVMIDEDGLASLEYDDQVTKWFKDQMEMSTFEEIMEYVSNESGSIVQNLMDELKDMEENKLYMDVLCDGENYDDPEWLESNVNCWEGFKMTVEQECEGRKYKLVSWGLEYDVNLMVVFED